MTAQQSLVPHLAVDGAAAAIEFYKTALGATEASRMPAEDGKRLMHAEILVNGAIVYLHDDFPEYAEKHAGSAVPPKRLGGTAVTLHLEVQNCDAAVGRAVAAGAKVVMAPWDAFWGARYAEIVDPFGHCWAFAHPLPGQPG